MAAPMDALAIKRRKLPAKSGFYTIYKVANRQPGKTRFSPSFLFFFSSVNYKQCSEKKVDKRYDIASQPRTKRRTWTWPGMV